MWSAVVIKTPVGDYVPQTDDLEAAIRAAARHSKLKAFKVLYNGRQVDEASDLPTGKVSELNGSECVLEIRADDKAA